MLGLGLTSISAGKRTWLQQVQPWLFESFFQPCKVLHDNLLPKFLDVSGSQVGAASRAASSGLCPLTGPRLVLVQGAAGR